MTKILVINHALVQEAVQTRWRLLAESAPFKVRLLVPEKWVFMGGPFKGNLVFKPRVIQQDNFEVCPVPTTNDRKMGSYLIKNLHKHLREFSPDVIFCIQTEDVAQLYQSIIYKRLFSPHAKLIYFTMYAYSRVIHLGGISTKKILKKVLFALRWWLVRHGTDGALVHYPGILDQIQKDGYRKPILVQTQHGVDPEIFYPDPLTREAVRRNLGLEKFVIGYAGRLCEEKGLFDLLRALQNITLDWQLLLVGDGELRQDIEAWIERQGWKDRVRMTGHVPMNDVAQFMNAMDCFFTGSRTTGNWIDTFPLAVAQAMAVGLPVVGSDNGAIPYQLGKAGLIFPEGNFNQLQQCLLTLAMDEKLREKMGKQLLKRARSHFCISGMNDKFSAFVRELLANQSCAG